MSINKKLETRSNNQCELCKSSEDLRIHFLSTKEDPELKNSVVVCKVCNDYISNENYDNDEHWRALNSSMWSEHIAVQVLVYRTLRNINKAWSNELHSQMYMEEDIKSWAESTIEDNQSNPTKDSNGANLKNGDSVTLIKDLDVKGAGFTAKRGTLVKNINLTDDSKYIEGRVNGIKIVLVANFLKKVN